MSIRNSRLLLGILLLAATSDPAGLGCGPGGEEGPGAAAREPAGSADFAGTYRVKGFTVDRKSGDTRRIEGTVVLVEKEAGDYSAKADLETDFPSPGGPIRADVIGAGQGTRSGDVLSGTAHTQLVMGTVPGVDTDFAFVPRQVGPRIVSSWSARFDDDGVLVVELENRPGDGEDYSPTSTTLHGTRLPDASE
jgi:hypothetical protein